MVPGALVVGETEKSPLSETCRLYFSPTSNSPVPRHTTSCPKQIKYADGVYNTHKDQGNHQYNSLQELVNHHKEGKHGFQVVLTKPCPRPK